MPKRKLLSYLAGFFDGEGYIGIVTGKGCRSLRVSITQKDRTILNLFQCLFGGNISQHCKSDDCYRWYLGSNAALKLLEDLSPYLMLKAGQAKIAIEFQRHKNPKNRNVLEEADIILEKEQQNLIKRGKEIALYSRKSTRTD